MKWKCLDCGQSLKGTEKYCPNCAAKIEYYCVKCNKQLESGRKKLCPLCLTEKKNKRKENLKECGQVAGVAVAGVGLVIKKVFGK